MLTQEEKDIVDKFKAEGRSPREIAGFIGGNRTNKPSTLKKEIDYPETPKGKSELMSFLDKETRQDIKKTEDTNYAERLIENVGTDIYNRTERFGSILDNKETGTVEKGVQLFGQGAGLAANTLEQTVTQIPGVEKVVGAVGSGINWLATSKFSPIKYLGDAIGSNEKLQEAVQLYDTDQNFKDTVDGVANTARLGMDVSGAVETANFMTNVTNKLINSPKTVNISGAVDAPAQIASVVDDIAKPNIKPTPQTNPNFIQRGVERFKTNIKADKVTNQTIDELPSVTARNSVRQGIELPDAQFLYQVPKTQLPPLKKLYDATTKFVAGKTKTNPRELVGKPVVKRLTQLQNQVNRLGKELDTTADSLNGKTVSSYPQIMNDVNASLNKIRVSMNKGKLKFKGSNLEGLGANEGIINNVYQRLLKVTDAADMHRLKKYIDNNVTYGKTSGGFTGEAESLLKSWRKQIDTALDTQFPKYNTVNTELANRIRPIKDLQKILKEDGLDIDLVNLKAGDLMRRLTSNASSRTSIMQVLRDLDKATKVKGKVSLNVENLVEFYSLLEKYYPEIVGKNTFKGQITGAIENVQGVQEMLVGVAKKMSGKTADVQRKAINELMEDLFKKLQ